MAFLFAVIAGLTSGWTGFGFAVRAAAIFTIISWIFHRGASGLPV